MQDEPDPKRKLTPEEIYENLKPLYDEMMAETATNKKVCNAVEKSLGSIAFEHYPNMADEWQAEQYRELAGLISRTASDFCTKLSNVDYHARKSEG